MGFTSVGGFGVSVLGAGGSGVATLGVIGFETTISGAGMFGTDIFKTSISGINYNIQRPKLDRMIILKRAYFAST